jgi:hypothetical protein
MRVEAPVPATAKKTSIETYRDKILKILQSHHKIKLVNEDIAYANTLTTEAKLDQFYVSMLNKYWG